jgi:hypothetical protein
MIAAGGGVAVDERCGCLWADSTSGHPAYGLVGGPDALWKQLSIAQNVSDDNL